mmetsp:Transcript_129119/g.373716  ORF Transcript_129119/g.373716 Transcript_129119/m.373716 type:complete len:524 (-) Transcript_129119:102-1673(-)
MSSLDDEKKKEATASPEVKDAEPVEAPKDQKPLPTKPDTEVSTCVEDTSSDQHEDYDGDEYEQAIPSSQLTSFSQQPLSQMDEEIRMLEKDGELGQVVGSQSMLSQELICSSQRSVDEYAQSSFQAKTGGYTAVAREVGLLPKEEEKKEASQDVDTGPSVEVKEVAPALAPPSPQRMKTRRTPPRAAAMKKKELQAEAETETTVRESEVFGSLLEAVEKITKTEEYNAKMVAWEHNTRLQESGSSSSSASSTAKNKSKNSPKRKSPTAPSSPKKKSRKTPTAQLKEKEQRESQETAKRAAALAEQTITDPEMAKKLLLSMALVRENPRSVPSELPQRGATVPEGFFWAHYPPLEAVLKEHMAEYYDLSTTKCQSAQQQAFNNDLVVLVREVATNQGWVFHPSFTDKGLRDRIRCYYKTHIQNAKKRLRTMVRNPTKRANARHLCAHLDLIQKHGVENSVGDDDSAEDRENMEEDEEDDDVVPPSSEPPRSRHTSVARKVSMEASPNMEEAMSQRALRVPAFEV